jgi:prepilin-type N-terminal cleavage/methylation domain-containing protein
MNFPQELNKGFTLIELLLVIALISAIAAFSTPFYVRFLTQNSVSLVQNQLTSHLRRAQFNALIGKNNSSWGVTHTSDKLVLFQGSSYATRIPNFDESFFVSPSISIVGLNEILFAKKTGLPSSTPTISISGVGSSKSVSINSIGAVQQ